MTFYGVNQNGQPYVIRTNTIPHQTTNWWSMGATMPRTMPKDIRNYPTFNKQSFGSVPRFRK
jgi:hypothetical protein